MLTSLLIAASFALLPDPTPLETQRAKYVIDFAKMAYATPETEHADERRAASIRHQLDRLKGKVGQSAPSLLKALSLDQEASAIEQRIDFVSHLHWMLDTTYLESPSNGYSTPWLARELQDVDEKAFGRFERDEPKLKPFRYMLSRGWKGKSHSMPEVESLLMSKLEPSVQGWQAPLFEQLSTLPPGADSRKLHAFTLLRLSEALNRTAKLHKFNSVVDEYCFSLDLEEKDVKRILEDLASQKDLTIEVNTLRKDHPRKGPAPTFLPDEAVADVLEALEPLGPEYQTEMKALFDPSNGRIDINGGPHRSGLGTGWGVPASQPSIMYWPIFTGVYDDLDRGLSHEGGHAVHYQLMRNHGVPTAYSDGPGYFFESFAEFNQIMLADHLYQKESDPARKLFFLGQVIDKARYPLYLAPFPALEFAIHNGVLNHTVQTEADLDRLAEETWTRFGATQSKTGDPIWARNETYYTHPLYNINHLMGAVLAVTYYQAYLANPKEFVPKYLDLMRNGFDAPPAKLLHRFLGIELNDPKLVGRSTDFLRSRLAEYRKLMEAT